MLNQKIATAFTPVAQIISLDGPGMASETFEADTLDNTDAGIPYQSTGRTEGGSVSGEFSVQAVKSSTQILQIVIIIRLCIMLKVYCISSNRFRG